jgi:hypothetical protein
MPPEPPSASPDPVQVDLLRTAQSIASLPFRHQQRLAMLGVIRERLVAIGTGSKVPSVAELLECYPGGADSYWRDWLTVEPVQDVPVYNALAVHAAARQSDIVPYRRQLATLLTPEQINDPELLRERLIALADHPAHAHLITSEARAWLWAAFVSDRTGARGRPTSRHLVLGLLHQWIKSGIPLAHNKAEQARALLTLFKQNFPRMAPPGEATIRNQIAQIYREAKSESRPKSRAKRTRTRQ